ncbi:DUF6894 family protein [Rhizobium ruizarguesonis]|uniref:DUF6894 family protein n=1 Tax=Rhizobium ruizarguesonis TaxID=2081791 RepID=UPI0013C0487A|nr:hypothetical protein [Rhizobium ruizarguesonis]NEI96446.1 hypothetical protein [Rhizobium ruizarguesonis]NEJ33931.1 hypothetical protein [Rhizobium ruizarguesonis]
MPRFYFNILSEAGSLDDWEGTELPDLDAARVEAVRDARQLMSSAVLIVSDKLTPSGVGSVGRCISDRRFTNCELLCLRLALELETSI